MWEGRAQMQRGARDFSNERTSLLNSGKKKISV